MDLATVISNRLRPAMGVIVDSLKDELRQQGHVDTGQLDKSIRFDIEIAPFKVVSNVWAAGQMDFLETGTRPRKVTGGQVRALTAWFGRKGLNMKEARAAAWATAVTQVRQGNPTIGSYRFSKNGRRKEALRYAVANAQKQFLAQLALKPDIQTYIKKIMI